MRKKTIYLFVMGIVVTLTLASAGFVFGQNANSSTTMTANTNTATKKPRRHKAKPKPAAAATETATTETPEASQKVAMSKRRTGRCDPTQQEQTDLSGTYTGKAKHGSEPAMDATLTITGSNFTMTMGSDTHSGHIAAVTTCGYTAVAVSVQGEGGQMMTHSLRARKVGDNLTLTSVAGEPEKMSFTTGGARMAKKPRHRTMKPKTAAPAASPTTPPQ